MDCLKTLQQSDIGMHMTLLQAAHYLWETAGVLGFYHGFLTYAFSDALGGALKFSVWELWKQKTETSYLNLWIGAALAFIASSVIIVPGEFLKNQLQMSHYDGLWEAVQGIYSTSGLPGFFVGYDGVFYRDVPYTMLELGLYEVFKSVLESQRPDDQQRSAWEEVVAAAVTGGLVAFLTTPLDTVKTKLMVDDYVGASFLDCLLTTVQNHGWASLFAGVLARIGWILPFTAIYLPTY